ncbi:hypothetical protein [Acuticoccus sp. I52.16.1]|uniref:hypothetical protein n=1 Tax=Acuticoccus sp. I52.16.1 TaxID=2928472 RepID=UPI001FD28F9F|nr:hypothetical protein [Acuticoccus sp. I52.16.1]UOM36626.1 hypothetical protein MRB58_10745 [Acuticoccus sp. I52.16.1]
MTAASTASVRADAHANHVRLEGLDRMQIGDIAALPAEDLALLQDEATTAFEAAKRTKEWLESAIAMRFAERANVARLSDGKDTGTVRFEEGQVTVVADLPKRIDWDQDALAGIVERIREAGDEPADYVETTLKVPERRYGAWPPAIAETFEPARTVRTGKQTFRLFLNTEVSR